MKIISPSFEILTPLDGKTILKHIELCGRVCYKSEDKITDTSAAAFVAGIIKRGHEAVLEHFNITIKFICDRGVSHELVRHRLASYCQESTRYCNYSKEGFGGEITVIRPAFLMEGTKAFACWRGACETAERSYFSLLEWGCSPQEARSVLPNSLKTEVVMTANLRAAHPELARVMAVNHITAKDVAAMMGLLKVARIATGNKADSFVDLAGYAACAGEIATAEGA